ncbi:DUF4083 family protein [Bacillus sp. NEB1478]|uniref:DUF4083 family protein n=1 Tax=Bacillus sp. NEB1478 TaxID=3073816 RepID=UPI002873372A|nr:DUF4083 family protein [Bacillus sp. NEB1478]WNB91205.1 DUF4083 family protein [Bacillus sp. NEB1478]
MKSFIPIIFVFLLILFIFSFVRFVSNTIKRQKYQQNELAKLNHKLDEVLHNQRDMRNK